MKVRTSSKATSAAVEYFLYAIVIIQTAIAAFAYKTFFPQSTGQWSNATIYLTVIYFSVLAGVFYLLNRLHANRKALGQAVVLADQETVPVEEKVASVAVPIRIPSLFGFTPAQLVIVLMVFLAALKLFGWALANLLKP